MSTSAIRRKSYKKAQQEAEAFAPIQWEGNHGGGVEVPAGKLQVMEKFFTPVPSGKEGKGAADMDLRSCHQQWADSRSDRGSTLSWSSSTTASTSSASWSSEASFNKKTFLKASPHSQHSQSCVDISSQASAFHHGRDQKVAYKVGDPSGSMVRLRKGQSKSADRLSRRQGHQEVQLLPGQTDSIDRRLYKSPGLERSLMFNEQAEILAPGQPRQTAASGPSKGILKNGAVTRGDRLRKAKSIETITVRSLEGESRPPPGPVGPLQRQKQPPSSLDLSAPKKSPNMKRRKLTDEKMRFSQFLNEITQQVMSPSSLCSLGWKPPAVALASKPPSTDGSDSKGSSSKASSPGSFLDVAEGKEEKPSRGRRRLVRPSAKGDFAHNHYTRQQPSPAPARTTDETSTSPECGPPAPLTVSWGSLPKQPGEASQGRKKLQETKAGLGKDSEGQELPLQKAEEDMAGVAEKPSTTDHQENRAGKTRTLSKEFLEEVNTEQRISPQLQQPTSSVRKDEEQSRSGQKDLQKTWEELESLKENFSKFQQDYSDTRQTNQLLEEKLQNIAQIMAEERQALNQRINELLERLVMSQNTLNTLEKLNISGLLSKSTAEHQHEKADSPDSFCSLTILDIVPPPDFRDGISDAHPTPIQFDSATETSKLGCSSESDTATPNGEEIPLLSYKALSPPPEVPSRHCRNHTQVTAFKPWKQTSTKFSVEHVNSAEGPESVVFGLVHPTSPSGVPPSGPLERVPEVSSSESSDDGEVSWCPGLMEKASGSHLDYQAAQKMLDSLLRKNSGQEKTLGKEPLQTGRLGGFSFTSYQEGNGPGRTPDRQHRIRFCQDFSNPVEELAEGKSYPCLQYVRGSLPRGAKGEAGGLESIDAAQDSTLL
ncbi:uncharacterized protein LOC125432739 isoform X2 [Sphaerodactylus townsendi]|uniref:uncharacterized protein LOC125432739 isoform X2 n=1 Tax=Sphaerodactylus townsendi TaxID=933632 RepID=UPI002026A725|nr:uncharacterized protein LOC125432739 isoform X2 [Sphaerodactylus townsendi]